MAPQAPSGLQDCTGAGERVEDISILGVDESVGICIGMLWVVPEAVLDGVMLGAVFEELISMLDREELLPAIAVDHLGLDAAIEPAGDGEDDMSSMEDSCGSGAPR